MLSNLSLTCLLHEVTNIVAIAKHGSKESSAREAADVGA